MEANEFCIQKGGGDHVIAGLSVQRKPFPWTTGDHHHHHLKPHQDRDWMHSTRVGAVIDLGRMINSVTDYIDYGIEPRWVHWLAVLWLVPLV